MYVYAPIRRDSYLVLFRELSREISSWKESAGLSLSRYIYPRRQERISSRRKNKMARAVSAVYCTRVGARSSNCIVVLRQNLRPRTSNRNNSSNHLSNLNHSRNRCHRRRNNNSHSRNSSNNTLNNSNSLSIWILISEGIEPPSRGISCRG